MAEASPGRLLSEVPPEQQHGLFANLKKFFVHYTLGAGALCVLLVIVAAAAFAPWYVPSDPLSTDFTALKAAPSGEHWFGTDRLGRDVFSRVLYGARSTLVIAFIAVAIGDGFGFTIGIISAYAGGRFDLISQRVLEVFLALPALILALLLGVAIGKGLDSIIIAIAVTRVPDSARVVRSRVLSIKEEPYVEAARVIGSTPLRVALRHVAPQTLSLFLVIFSINLGFAVFAEAALSYLGVGVRPPTPTWGNMLGAETSHVFRPLWWMFFFPGTAIVVTVLAMNLLGDAIRDFADPRAAERREENQ
ncbi:MAG: ABC transporter permease [Chloroflexi bacterium]|nr:ABC transporter permease [Chloroflexota bacterium]MYA20478.1 ABC transporter permease [Chloroflexota bacterium]MYE47509.1 ABC transporter permease [Chloroflexota bacterium]